MGKHDKPWNIKVVRRMFETTSIEQLEDGDEQDWERPLSIHFIGEEGIDAGGLTREFFSLLFKSTKVFEGNTFSVNPQLLDSKQYSLIGKAVAKAIMSGHPGQRCLNQHVARYIILGKEPDFANVKTEEICRAEAVKAINDVRSPCLLNFICSILHIVQLHFLINCLASVHLAVDFSHVQLLVDLS